MHKQVILCDKCVNIDLNKLVQKIHADVLKVDNCEQKVDIEIDYDHVVFGCPALYHASDYCGMYEIIDLRLLEKFKKPENVAADLINSSLITALPETKAIETDYTVIYWGNNLDVISQLSENTNLNLTVITDRHTVKKLHPFHIRVVEVDKDHAQAEITGSVGNFEVNVNGYDPIKGMEGDFSLRAGQLIIPHWLSDDREGLYSYANTSDEFQAALKVVNNLGGYTKINPIKIHYEMCATSKSGYTGCEICFSCPQNAVSTKGGKITISGSCNGCGYCAAACPVSVIDYTLLPSHELWEKIDAVLEENKTVAFVCEDALRNLYGLEDRKLPQISPVVVPCTNVLSEVHYLYTALKGANVVVIPCEEKHNLECYNLAKKTLNAFGFDCLKTSSFDELKETKFKGKKPGNILGRLEGENKREQWYYMVKKLMESYPVRDAVIDTDAFATVEIDTNCTLCMTCTHFCPTGAIRKENESIYFNHGLCIACDLCTACPEGALTTTKMLDLHQVGDREIYRGELLCCPSCGKPHIPRNMYDRLNNLGEYSLLFCSECRPKIILESIYDEMAKEQKKGEKNE